MSGRLPNKSCTRSIISAGGQFSEKPKQIICMVVYGGLQVSSRGLQVSPRGLQVSS